MNGTSCNCKNPKSGGTKCPPQHIAICFRGRNNDCYGECIPISNRFKNNSSEFSEWARHNIEYKIAEHLVEFADMYKVGNDIGHVLKNFQSNLSMRNNNSFGRLQIEMNGVSILVSFAFSFLDEQNLDDYRVLT